MRLLAGLNPFVLYIIYIITTLVLAYSPISGFYDLGLFPLFLAMLAIVGLCLGFSIKAPPPAPRRLTTSLRNRSLLFLLVFVFGFLPLVPAFVSAAIYVFQNGFYEYTRFAHWGDRNYPDFFFSTFHLSIVQNVSLAFLVAGLCVGVAIVVMEGGAKGFLISAFGLVMWAFVSSSRLHVILIVLSLAFSIMFLLHARRFPSRRSIRRLGYLAAILFGFFVFLTFLRVGSNFSGFEEHVFRYVVGYHTYGYALLDSAVKGDSPASRDSIGLGMYSFPAPSFIYQQLSVRLSDYRPEVAYRALGQDMQKFVEVGKTRGGDSIEVNAFYTVLWPLWLDFRAGLIFFFVFYGFIFRRVYDGFRRYGDTASLSMSLFLSLAGYGFFLGGVVTNPSWWFAFFLMSGFYIKQRYG